MYSKKAVKLYEEGRSLQQQKKLLAAERAYKKALKTNPEFVEAYNNLGNVLVDRERLREATDAYSKALQILPNHPMLLNNLGNALQLQGENDKAIKWLNKAILQDPNYADTYCNLGNALRDIGNYEDAFGSYEQATKIDPGHEQAFLNLGILQLEKEMLDDATANLNKAIEINPKSIKAYCELGNVMRRRGNSSDAIALYHKALDIDPKNADTYVLFGKAYMSQRKWDEAAQSYQQAIGLKPDLAAAYLGLSTLKNFDQDEKIMESMDRQSRKSNISSEDLARLSFALGKAHGDSNNFDKAFSYIERGNKLKWEALDYDVTRDTDYFEKIKSAFRNQTFADIRPNGSTDVTPIFILGLPRSGKTLTETMLAEHPLVYAAGELNYMRIVLSDAGDLQDPQALVQRILNLPRNDVVEIAKNYIGRIQSLSSGEPFVVDTMPANFNYIGFINLLFPRAKVIHCCRQPMDACWFIYQKCFQNSAYDYSYDLATLAAYYSAYSGLMAHWHKVSPGYIHNLEYERLVTDTQATMSELASFIGIEWDGVCLDHYMNNPLNDSDIGIWQHYEKHLDPLRNGLN